MSSNRWHFFVFRNFVEKFCVSWAFPLIECVAVWALKTPVPHTDVLKTHSSQSFSTELLEYKGTGSKHLSQPNDKVFSEYNPKNFSFLKHLSDYTPYFSHSLHKILFLQERWCLWCLGEGVSMNGYKRTGIRLCVFCTPIPLCVCRAGAPFSGAPFPRHLDFRKTNILP